MDKILSFIAKETNGKCYTSFKFCHDGIAVPSIDYEDKSEGKTVLKDYGETDHSPNMRDLSKKAKQLEGIPPLFNFFLDGSRRTYKVDDIEYQKKVYPIIAGQIGVGCTQRIDKSKFCKVALENNLVLSLPECAYADGYKPELYFSSLTEKINQIPSLKKYNLKISKILAYESGKKLQEGETYENKGIAKIQSEMTECEKKVVSQLTAKNLLSYCSYLLKDGSLQYKPMKTGDFKEISKIRNNYRWVVGVSKHFNPELIKDKNDKNNAGIIAELKPYHRTPVLMYKPGNLLGDVKYAIWYVRIREKEHTNTVFSGVLKIEKMLMTGAESEKGLETDEVDAITANIINERNPVCYGNDNRWANHLYPIYLTEQYIKSQYISDLHLINLF